ncbi:MAG: phosphoribosylanthranilate isomerase [Bacteroidetes bacterium]|jgi:phosphoribosylanthranilate isomerase|nr:phosphoribosylanthranilate isomerase [Bacteroidota bacterium]MBT4399792.1 phosphoribosylanthranilate isomerase [Bacteroidota bacterium]MBT4410305.1 phosphoribosylanthranilate isomerase [Bacteroidota bacterium]MBT5427143.1 phosphoribosylanthranilate isomerase [Bacteroidota bacterium]MBT7094678.1 phosphoribosylanthranilate isomerase [Bacteroidota bacterium]
MKRKIKICGITDPDNLIDIIRLGPEFIGLIFYEKSPRFVTEISRMIPILSLPRQYKLIGVFVNESLDKILEISIIARLDGVQLHGSESPEFCRECQNNGLFVIKAFGVGKEFNFEDIDIYQPNIDLFLFDSNSPGHGGSGNKFEWNVLSAYHGETPFLLSGGVSPDDQITVKNSSFLGVDLNSRFEIKAGLKNIESLNYFITKYRNE